MRDFTTIFAYDALEGKFYELLGANEWWEAHVTVCGELPATLHVTKNDAEELLEKYSRYEAIPINFKIQPMRIMPLTAIARKFKVKEANLEFKVVRGKQE